MIPYLQGGETPTAEQWNVLFSALDNKIGKTLDNKSLLTIDRIQDGFGNWIGPRYFFLGSGSKLFVPSVFTTDGTAYDHTVYDGYAGGDVLGYDVGKRLVHIQRPVEYSTQGFSPLDTSLEVHKRSLDALWIPEEEWPEGVSQFWIVINQKPEHSWPLVQIEVVFDGQSGDELSHEWPAKYDKFNVFRFHNLNSETLTITFEDKPTVSISIPARQSRCVRRTEAGGDYTTGYRYLQKMVDDDPRFFVYGSSGMFGDYPAAMPGQLNPCAANNAANPFVIYDLISKVFCGVYDTSSLNKWPRLIFDPHTVWDAYSLYSSLYGDPDGDETKIGDLLHHKGKLVVAKKNTETGEVDQREVEFKGYTNVETDLADGGIHVEKNYDDGTIELSDPDEASNEWAIVGTKGTNLLSRAGEVVPAVDLHADSYAGPVGEAIYRKVYAVTPTQGTGHEQDFRPLDTVDESDQTQISTVTNKYTDPELECSEELGPVISYNDTTDTKVSEDPLEVEVKDGAASDSMRLYSTRVADIKTLKYWGDEEYEGSEQDTDIIAHTDERLVLTGAGLRFLCKATIQPNKLGVWDASKDYSIPYWLMDGNDDGIFLHETVTISKENKFEVNRHIDFTGYGFPYADGTNCPQPMPSVDHNKRLPLFNVGDDLSNSGGYPFAYWRASSFVPPRVSRRYKGLDHITYSPTSGLYIWKHPAITEELYTDGTWIPASGKGFSYQIKPVSGDEEDIKVITPVQYCAATVGDIDLIRAGSRSQFSLIANPDVLYWWHANRKRDGFYTDTNRDKLIQNEIMPYDDDEWRSSLDTSINRMLYLPLCIEHFNNMVQLVNSVKSYVPYFENFFRYLNEFGELKQLTFVGPPDGIFNGSGPFPRNALFTVDSADSETLEMLDDLGIELKTIDDLPGWLGISETQATTGEAVFDVAATFHEAMEVGDAEYQGACAGGVTLTYDLEYVICAQGWNTYPGWYKSHIPLDYVLNDWSSQETVLLYDSYMDGPQLTIRPGTTNELGPGDSFPPGTFFEEGKYKYRKIYYGVPARGRFSQTNILHGTLTATLNHTEITKTEDYTLLSRLAEQYGCEVPTEYNWVDISDYLAAATRLGYNVSVSRFGQGVWFGPMTVDWEQLHPGYTFNGRFIEQITYHDAVALVTESSVTEPNPDCGHDETVETKVLGASTDPADHAMMQPGMESEFTIPNLPMNMLAIVPADTDAFEWCVPLEDNSTAEEEYAKIISKLTIGDHFLKGSTFTITDTLVGQDATTCAIGHPERTWQYSFGDFMTIDGVYGGCTLPMHVILKMVLEDGYENLYRSVNNRYTWQADNVMLETGTADHTIPDGVLSHTDDALPLWNNDTLPLRYACNAFLDYYSTVEVDDIRAVYIPRILIDNAVEYYSEEDPVKAYARVFYDDYSRARVPATVTVADDDAEVIELENPEATKWTIFAEPADGKAFKVMFYKRYRMLAKQQTTTTDDPEIRVTLEADDADYGDGDELTGCPTSMEFKVEALS